MLLRTRGRLSLGRALADRRGDTQLDTVEGLSDTAKKARDRLFAQMARVRKVGVHLADKRDARQAALATAPA